MLDPSLEPLDETPIDRVRFPTRIYNLLAAADVKTIGEIRTISDAELLSFQDCGAGTVSYLRRNPWFAVDRWGTAPLTHRVCHQPPESRSMLASASFPLERLHFIAPRPGNPHRPDGDTSTSSQGSRDRDFTDRRNRSYLRPSRTGSQTPSWQFGRPGALLRRCASGRFCDVFCPAYPCSLLLVALGYRLV
jgi:Bacterial RNA polymerase, alpha chain C terminal domain